MSRAGLPKLKAVCLEDFDRSAIPLVMNAIDATLMTSDREGSPVAVRESLACRTPVVSVPVGDVPEIIADLPGCHIASYDPADLSQRLIEAVRAGKPAALRSRAELYSRDRVARRLVALYEDVVRGRQRQ
jgi:glycosyltransferase involved in cell wall biosynthesis